MNLRLNGTASQSSTAFGGSASRAIDGNTNGVYGAGSITHTGNDPGAWWQVDLGEEHPLERIVLWNRTDCCSERLTNFRLSVMNSADEVVFESAHFTEGRFPSTQDYEVVLPAGSRGRIVHIAKLGPDRNGDYWLSLAEVQVFQGSLGFGPLIGTDLEAAMRDRNASAYLRIPFIADPETVEFLELRMKYDDGFVAYLNGREVARRNAPALPDWNATATSEHPDGEAFVFEAMDITAHRDVLQAGANVLAVHGLNVSAGDEDFLIVCELSGSTITSGETRYFLEPTPGAPNETPGVDGFVADTKFSRDRGFYDAPFDVAITTETEGATIRYTTDGSAPTEENGMTYTGPIDIAATTTLRSAAFKADHGPTNVDTHTYVFPADVVRQTGAGFPRSWGGAQADYEMDPEVVDDPAYMDTIENDIIITIPTLSIVMDVDDLFGPGGIYSNTEGRGQAWERPCSMEMIYPADWRGGEDQKSEQLDCGIRIFGFGWRSHTASLKHAFRLLFKRSYGPGKLRFEFFPDFDVEALDEVVLRAQGSRSWNDSRASIHNTQYIRDAWARYTARDMGKLTTSSTFVHLYLNGLYWGLYNPVERPEAQFMANHLGGEEEDYDALNARVGSIEVIDGSREGWDRLIAIARVGPTTLEEYQAIEELLDVRDLVDYMLINFYTGNRDWAGANGNNMRVAGAPGDAGGYKSFCWDMEYSIWDAGDNVLSVLTQYDTPAAIHASLRSNPEYRLLFADRTHKHLRNGGALTPEETAKRWMDRALEIDRAIVGESARWGDRRREPPFTRDVEWIRERNRLLTSYFPQRTDILLDQLKQARLYTELEPPSFNRPGGLIEPGFVLSMTALSGGIFFTIDGRDPRLPGGEVAPEAIEFGTGERTALVPARSAVRVLVPDEGASGLDWTSADFDDAAWIEGKTGVGFEQSSGYEALISTDVGDRMFQVNGSVYLRISFDVEAPSAGFLTLRMKYDDGFVAYLNGRRVAASNAPEVLEWNSIATASHSDSLAVLFEDFDLSGEADLLRTGRNVLAIHGLNRSAANGDLLILPQLEAAEPPGEGDALVLRTTTHVRARAWRDGRWSALSEAVFVTPGLRITEIMYHPPDLPAGNPFDADDFEFIELMNVGDRPLDLDGVRLAGGVRFSFEDGAVNRLDSRDVVLVVKDIEAIDARYDTRGMKIAGEYFGNLSNRGEEIILEGNLGERILQFTFADSWQPETDGGGRSLVVVDAAGDPGAWGEAASWRPSVVVGGTPGEHSDDRIPGGWQLIGDANQDASLNISDAVSVLRLLFVGGEPVLPCGEAVEERGNLLLFDTNGDGAVNMGDPIHLLSYLFRRGAPPVPGADCIRVHGCPDVCAP